MKIEGISSPSYITSVQSISKDLDKAQSFAQTLDSASKQNDKKLYESCQELESVFVARVFDSMRATISRSELLSRGFADDVFESMLYDEYAKNVSKSGSIGLADILYKQLK